jgi:hypothetical protein
MTAMPLTCSNVSEAALAPKASITVTPFQPLEADILNASIPLFFIGRDKDGFWLAREVGGRVALVQTFLNPIAIKSSNLSRSNHRATSSVQSKSAGSQATARSSLPVSVLKLHRASPAR